MPFQATISVSILTVYFYTLFLILRSRPCSAASSETCFATCGDVGPAIRFPFSLVNTIAGSDCSLPGFGLRCQTSGNGANSTKTMLILKLPYSGEFTVRSINYTSQRISINDPGNCLPGRLLRDFSVSGSPFQPIINLRYTFLNCTSGPPPSEQAVMACLSGSNYSILATSSPDYKSSHCRNISTVLLPYQGPCSFGSQFATNLNQDIILTWDVPVCRDCEVRGGTCGFERIGPDSLIGCFNLPQKSDRLPRAAKYGLVLGAGIPGLLCLVGLACFIRRKVQIYRQRPRTSIDFSALTVPHPTLLSVGLDMPTIQSYPKTELGESKRLPKPSDNTCSICLCEYQPKETLRTIPECNHYFHMDCIDEWLRLNATCPLCRKSPEASSLTTSTSSLSLASVTSSV